MVSQRPTSRQSAKGRVSETDLLALPKYLIIAVGACANHKHGCPEVSSHFLCGWRQRRCLQLVRVLLVIVCARVDSLKGHARQLQDDVRRHFALALAVLTSEAS
mmetsp:Transcript_57745/g.187590  ORF Transcript_57745/g.187590 Transcript_57745/m.187590 type:complete len:104 (+) Transcript_57745:330-641(+)